MSETFGFILAYEDEKEMSNAFLNIQKNKKEYFEIYTFYLPDSDYPFLIVLEAQYGFIDELKNLINNIDLGKDIHISEYNEEILKEAEPYEFEEDIQPLIIGEDIPMHGGEAELVRWELQTDMGAINFYDTLKDALEDYPYNFEDWLKGIKNALEREKATDSGYWATGKHIPKLCPLYKMEYALINPYVVGWNNCILPLYWVKTEKECINYEGKIIENMCVIPFNEADQNEFNENKFRLSEINREFIFELARQIKIGAAITENNVEVPTTYKRIKLIGWKIVNPITFNLELKYDTKSMIWNTFDEALNAYDNEFNSFLKGLKEAKKKSELRKPLDTGNKDQWDIKVALCNIPVIVPQYEKYYIGEYGILPLKEQCASYGGILYKGMCIRTFTNYDASEYRHETDYFYFSEYKDRTEFIDMMRSFLEISEKMI